MMSLGVGKFVAPCLLVAVFVAVGACPARALAAECTLELDGEVLREEVAGVRRLVDPRCFVRSSTTAIGVTLVDGRYIEEILKISGDVRVFTRMYVRLPAGCPKGRSPLLRTLPTTLEITTTILHEVGRVERVEKKVDVHLICGPASTSIAVSAGNLVRFVVRYQAGGLGVR